VKVENAEDLVANLIGQTEDVGVVLGEAATRIRASASAGAFVTIPQCPVQPADRHRG